MKSKLSFLFQSIIKNYKATIFVGIIFFFATLLLTLYFFRNSALNNFAFLKLLRFQENEVSKVETVNNKIVNEESVVINVVSDVGDSIVSLVYLSSPFDDKGTPIGSGVVISSDGLIVTNKHVIDEDDGLYEVVFQNGEKHKVLDIIKDKSKDLALVKVDASNLKPVKLGNTKDIKLGQKAIAVGNALGLSNTVSVGIVSGLNREIEIEGEMSKNLIQTDAAINLGNSGGALLNSNGDLVGINTARSSDAENIGFAIPVDGVRDLIVKYQSGKISKDSVPAFLGIGFTFKDLKEYINRGLPIGPVVSGVVKNSPADKAGLKIGDIIVSIDKSEFSDEYDLAQFIKEKNPGDSIKIKVYRKNNTFELDAVLGEAVN